MPSFAENTPFTFSESGPLPTGMKYSIKIEEIPYVKSLNAKPDDGSTWGIDGGYPLHVIKTFFFSLNGKEIFIPRKLSSDICDLQRASIQEINGQVILTIKGGDAAGSFNAEFKFKNGRLVERLIRMGEFPEEVWEKIILHNELWNKEM